MKQDAAQPTLCALLVDDHPIVSNALSMGLKSMGLFTRIDQVSSLAKALERAGGKFNYNLIIVDLSLDDAQGTEAVKSVRAHFPEVPVVVFSAEDSPAIISAVYEQGVHGFIPKSLDLQEVMHAVRTVVGGGIYMSPDTARALGFSPPQQAVENTVRSASPVERLSPRQLQVLDYLLQGMQNKMIGQRLQMAEGTVKTHLNTIYRLFGVNSRAKLILRANELGLANAVHPDQ